MMKPEKEEQKIEGKDFVNSLEHLAKTIENLADLQAKSVDRIDKLTEAVTQLLTQAGHFEKMRAEDNHRMDKLEQFIVAVRSECVAEHREIYKKIETEDEKLADKIQANTSRIDQAKPIIGIIGALVTAAVIAAFSL